MLGLLIGVVAYDGVERKIGVWGMVKERRVDRNRVRVARLKGVGGGDGIRFEIDYGFRRMADISRYSSSRFRTKSPRQSTSCLFNTNA